MEHKEQSNKLLELMRDDSVPVPDRGDSLIFEVVDKGIDRRGVVRSLIEDADLGRKLLAKMAQLQEHSLVAERFIGIVRGSQLYGTVTRGGAEVCVPVSPEDIEGLAPGDPVLVDVQTDRIAGRDGQLPLVGDVVQVESRPPGMPGHAIVKHHDQLYLARLHHGLSSDPAACPPGARVVYDPQRRFVLAVVDTQSDGSELLVDPEHLETVRREDVGAPRTIVDDILRRVRMFVQRPDWLARMFVRRRVSYCFTGPTGSGKSFHLKLIASEVTDLVEALTGQRSSRLVLCDASQFWSPWFGETEQRIAAWAEKLQRAGAATLRGLDGRELHFPLIVVLEECEALLRSRGDQTGSGHLFDRPLAILLQKIESLESALQVPIIWICTTNRADLLDPAAMRRLGMRKVCFGTLSPDEAATVLAKKVPPEMPVESRGRRNGAAREALLGKTLNYLYGPQPEQAIADVHLVDGGRRKLHRRELVTPAVLEEAVSAAIDHSLCRSEQAGRLVGLEAEPVIAFLHRHFASLAETLRPHNIAEHCPDWFAEGPLHVTGVEPILRRHRQPVPLLVH